MPRIPLKTLLEALRINRALPYLLPVCKTITQAQQELRWIQNEVPKEYHANAILQRWRHVPLQYILGTQPFGNLDIICEPGVLIPRNDTEEWCFELIQLLKEVTENMQILDMCTGTGCIPLLLSSELKKADRIIGVDISYRAISLAERNALHNKDKLRGTVSFVHGDLFNKDIIKHLDPTSYELVISNPPYIPASEFNHLGGMEKSVRIYEPRLALEGDTEIFEALIENFVLTSNCNGFVFELAGIRQVEYVIQKMKSEKDWKLGYRVDSNGQYRNVLGWKQNSSMEVLAKICTVKL